MGVCLTGIILDAQKSAKKQALLDSAYSLFTSQGTEKTSISDIVQRAGIAKGTFYLYFKDKQDILQALTMRVSHQVISNALDSLDETKVTDGIERVVDFADYIIEVFKREPLMLRVVGHKFSFPALETELRGSTDDLYARMVKDLHTIPSLDKRTADDIYHLMYSLVLLVGTVCYSSIIENRPAPIDTMKPVIYDIIRKSLG